MTATLFEIRPGAYHDSIVLMQLQRALAGLPGVLDAGVVMGTTANHDLLAAGGLLPPGAEKAGANDLLIVVQAQSAEAAALALGQLDALRQQRQAASSRSFCPRSLRSAVAHMPQAEWVLISVPGRYAAGVAREALALNRHVFLYSDNVSLEDEIALKAEAGRSGRLLMGPDCGTAIINGIGLGFANRLRRGPIGLVGASGTGLQAISSAIHNLGSGVSQAIGTGGRDLSGAVGGVTTQQGLSLLTHDPQTKVIVLVSKPPDPATAANVLAHARAAGKPVVVCFIGAPLPGRRLGNLRFAASLHEAAQLAVAALDQATITPNDAGRSPGYLRGLFSGGTLAYEALLSLQPVLHPLYSNVPLRAEQELADPLRSQAHTILDMGDDIFTQGRLHPMMDNDLRLRRLRQEAADPQVGAILLDVVLGEGAHPNPAAELVPAIAAVRAERDLIVLAVVIGTDEDPQDMPAQASMLQAAGVDVFDTLTAAVAHINSLYLPAPAPVWDDMLPVSVAAFHAPFAAVNVGLESFAASLESQGAEVISVDWRPPAGGDERLMALLAKMK
jgi:FdrA protein